MRGLMPRCGRCGGIILGPGITLENKMYCGQSCASISLGGEYGFSFLLEGQTSR